MPYFIVLARDRVHALCDRTSHRQQHLDYWAGKPGMVKVAGAILDGEKACGSSFVIEAENEEEVRAALADDPFTRAGVFAGELTVIMMRPAIGEWLPVS